MTQSSTRFPGFSSFCGQSSFYAPKISVDPPKGTGESFPLVIVRHSYFFKAAQNGR